MHKNVFDGHNRASRMGYSGDCPESKSVRRSKQGDNCVEVYVVDDDSSLREALTCLLQTVGMRVQAFSSAAPLLERDLSVTASCLVMDIRMPTISGLEFQQYLLKTNIRTPIIFMTGHADVQMTVRAMKAGAFDFLTKPFREQEMIEAVMKAIKANELRLEGERHAMECMARFEELSDRERQTMELITAGSMNKQAAAEIGIAVSTIKTYRGQIMRKMEAKTLADLVRMAETIGMQRRAQTRAKIQ